MTPGDRIRDLPSNNSPSDSAFTYIVDGVGGDGKINKEALRSWLNIKESQVELRKADGSITNFTPTANTNAARETALRSALSGSDSGSLVFIGKGDYKVSDGSPLIDSVLEESYGVKIVFGEGAALLYDDPEDSESDGILFQNFFQLESFGLREFDENGDEYDNWKALQSAMNACPKRPDNLLLESGRYFKNGGTLIFPKGTFYTSKTWFISPTTVVRGVSEGAFTSNLKVFDGTFTDPEDPHYVVKMEDPKIILGVPQFSKNNCFGAEWSGVNLIQDDRSSNLGLAGMYWYGAQLSFIDKAYINNHALDGLTLYGCTIGQLWITNSGKSGLKWTGGGNAHVLSVERCNPTQADDPETTEKIPWIDLSDGSFTFGLIQSEDSPPLTDEVTLIHAYDIINLSISSVYLGCTGSETRNHTVLRLTSNCHNVNVRSIFCFPNTSQTLVDDRSQQSPNGPGIQFLLTGNTGQYDQTSGGKPGGKAVDNTWTGLNTFTNQTVFGTTGTVNSFLFRANTGTIDLGDGKYETSRSTSYFSAGLPRPQDWNNGKMALSVSGSLYTAGGYNVESIDGDPEIANIPIGYRKTYYNFDAEEIRDWVNIGGVLFKSAAYTPA